MDFDNEKHYNNQKDTSAVADKELANILPKLIMYDAVAGVPHNAQDVRVARIQQANIANIPWKEWPQ